MSGKNIAQSQPAEPNMRLIRQLYQALAIDFWLED
jgi:hypothetical protein